MDTILNILAVVFIVLAVVQFIQYRIKKSKVKYLTNLDKANELMLNINQGYQDYVDAEGRNILMIAAGEEQFVVKKSDVDHNVNFIKVIEKCLQLGFNINDRSLIDEKTALYYACERTNNTDFIQNIMSKGGNPNIVSRNGRTPFFQVCMTGDLRMFDAIIGYVDDINRQDSVGLTPIMASVIWGNLYVAEKLLDMGANIHLTDMQGHNLEYHAQLNLEKHLQHSGNSAGKDPYGKANHDKKEIVRRIECLTTGQLYKYKKYVAPRSSVEPGYEDA